MYLKSEVVLRQLSGLWRGCGVGGVGGVGGVVVTKIITKVA